MERDLVHLMRRLFLPAAQKAPGVPWQPLVDLYHTRDGWLVKLDLAGIRPEDVELRIQGRRLTVSGSRRDCCVGETCGQYLMEIAYSHFERTLLLPEDIESLRLATEYRDGMLLVRLQRERQS
jgi:HSP20 family protein